MAQARGCFFLPRAVCATPLTDPHPALRNRKMDRRSPGGGASRAAECNCRIRYRSPLPFHEQPLTVFKRRKPHTRHIYTVRTGRKTRTDSYFDCHGFDASSPHVTSPPEVTLGKTSPPQPAQGSQGQLVSSAPMSALISRLCISTVCRPALQACKRPGGGWTQSVQDQVGLVSAQNDA